jgi:TatA/E family protein of Tat protein translocase
MLHVLALGWPGPLEMIMLAGLGLLIFGKRLPEVGRSVGRTIVEFKKGMREVENELNDAPPPSAPPVALPKSEEPGAANAGFKFDPYTGKPVDQTTTTPPAQT